MADMTIAHTIKSAAEATHIGRARIDEAIKLGNLVAYYVGNKAILRPADIDDWIQTFPTEKP